MQTRLIQIVEDQPKTDWGKLTSDSLASTVMIAEGIGSIAQDLGARKLSDSKFGKAIGKWGKAKVKSEKATLELASAAGASVFRSAKSLINTKKSGDVEIEFLSQCAANEITDCNGHSLQKGYVYAQHPLLNDIYFRSDLLHSSLLNEQRSQIIRYFRSAVALKSISIEIISQKTGNSYAGGGWNKFSASARHNHCEEQRRWFTATYNSPTREPLSPDSDLFWMPHFDEIVAATKDTGGGSIETITTINTSFGISANAAKAANIENDWLSSQSFVIRAEYE